MNLPVNRPRPGRRNASGFTMVEIAIALGVVAIALVAIIGIMPTGVNIQRTNRDDTVINQDGRLWLEAIRTGARGLDYLTNHVEAIWITNISARGKQVTLCTNNPSATRPGNPAVQGSMTNGAIVVWLLSQPKYILQPPPKPGGPVQVITNYITAYVHALSGSAADQNAFMRSNRMDFLYRLTSEVVPLSRFPPNLTNFAVSGLSTQEWVIRSNNWLIARNEAANAFDVRLTLQGPVIRRGQDYIALGKETTFRTTVSACQLPDGQSPGANLSFFKPATYVQVRP